MSEYLDPAEEAARRAAERGRLTDDLMIPGLAVRAFGVDSAREALAPIRALHKPGTEAGYEDEPYCETCGHYDGLSADFTHQPWPCDTARLIYTTEELSDE